jgi:hypothetical protein
VLQFVKELVTKVWCLTFVAPSGSVELSLGKAVNVESAQSAQPGAGVSEHIGNWPGYGWVVVPFRVAACGFLRPRAFDVPVKRFVEALEELFRHPRAGFGVQP